MGNKMKYVAMVGAVLVFVVVVAALLLLGGAIWGNPPATPTPFQPTPAPTLAPTATPGPTATPRPTATPPQGLSNPAAKYCADMNYSSEGEFCLMPDNSKCAFWSFYRGICGARFSFCEKHGGHLENRTQMIGAWTSGYSVCKFPGGSECIEQAYLNGSCRVGQCATWDEAQGGCQG